MTDPRQKADPARYKRTVLATCCVPWSDDGDVLEPLFRRTVRHLLRRGISDLYVFGTAGEGQSVNDAQFRQIVDAFLEEVVEGRGTPMVGVINLSLATVIERVEYAAERGCSTFQISLPNWGAVNDRELATFFGEICGRFPELAFLHYNLARAGRIVRPDEYADLASAYPNLVATKYGGGDPELVTELLVRAPVLRHFFTELGFFYGSAIGACGLLASVSTTNPARSRGYFDAVCDGDLATARSLYGELARLLGELRRAVGQGPHLDGAYDKVLAKIAEPEFPLRLLPPWESSTFEAYERYKDVLANGFSEWAPG